MLFPHTGRREGGPASPAASHVHPHAVHRAPVDVLEARHVHVGQVVALVRVAGRRRSGAVRRTGLVLLLLPLLSRSVMSGGCRGCGGGGSGCSRRMVLALALRSRRSSRCRGGPLLLLLRGDGCGRRGRRQAAGRVHG